MQPELETNFVTAQNAQNDGRASRCLPRFRASRPTLRALLAGLGAFAAMPTAAQAAEPPSIVTQKALTLDGARELIVAAQKVARARRTTGAVGPNGLAFSPDEKYLYVDNWDVGRKVIMRYEVSPDGSLRNGTVFLDLTRIPGEQAFDGLKVDQKGNVYAAGPGGLLVLSPAGQHLGTIQFSEQPANFAWGDADRRTLYVTARTGLYRVFLNVPGAATASSADALAGK